MKNDSVHDFYDRLYKRLFSHPQFLKSLVRFVLPPQILHLVDWNNISHFPPSFIPKNLRKTEADVIVKIPLSSGNDIFIFIIAELQSYPDNSMPLRMFIYTAMLYHHLLSSNLISSKIPIVLPVVIYTGDKNWNAPKNLQDMMDKNISNFLKQYLPDITYLLIDKNRYSLEELEQMKNAIAGILFLEKTTPEDDLADRLRKFWEVFIKGLSEEERNILVETTEMLIRHKFGINIELEKEIGWEVEKMLFTAIDKWKERQIEILKKQVEEEVRKSVEEEVRRSVEEAERRVIDVAVKLVKSGMTLEQAAEITGVDAVKIQQAMENEK